MAEDELQAFREHWKQELKTTSKDNRNVVVTDRNRCHTVDEETKNRYFEDSSRKQTFETGEKTKSKSDIHGRQSLKGEYSFSETRGESSSVQLSSTENMKDQPDYVDIAEGLLDGRTSPLRDRIIVEMTRRKRQFDIATKEYPSRVTQEPQSKLNRSSKLVEQLIQDLNEINEIPFFDVELPYELALQIFQYLSSTELGRCAQVSKMWKVLAEDEVLWYKLCLKEGYHRGAGVSDSPCWKSALRDCRENEEILRYNWKNRVGAIRNLQYELGKVLCDVSSCEGFVIAGYTSGDVRLWDTLHWDAGVSYLRPSHMTMDVTPKPHISHVEVTESVAAAAYEDGFVDVWSVETGQEPIHCYQLPQRVHGLALGSGATAVATASGAQVRVDCPVDNGHWRTLCQTELQKPVDSLLLVPGRRDSPLAAAAAGESAYLLRPGGDPEVLHSTYGHPVTCMDVTPSRAALAVKSCGWALRGGGNKIHVYNLMTGQLEVSVGSSAGDFTCINLKDGPPHLLACGNKDRRVRVYDLRTGLSVTSLYAHHVTAVQADDWKIVSGGREGLVCVWEMRMGAKLWEMHNRHPVRHVRFSNSTLVTANIPDEKSPRGACITDDDLTSHRRHRGAIYLYDFSVDATTPDHVLPICRSNYVESSGYNYNISLAMPYDALAKPHASL